MNNAMWCIVIMAIATCLSAVFLACLMTGRQYIVMVENLSAKDLLRDMYIVGFRLSDLLRINFHSNRAKKRIRQCAVIYGQQYGEYYCRLLVAKQITVFLLALILGLCLAAAMKVPLLAFLALGAAAGFVYYFETTVTDVTKARARSISKDFPTVLSSLALLVNAGMIVREAWEKIGASGEGVLYEEMQRTTLNIRNGLPETDAYLEFANRCDNDAVTKFAGALIQNLKKSNSELVQFLRLYAAENWQERKQAVRVQGEEASTKLLIPISIMLVGLLVMICMPIMSGIVT